MYSKIFIPYNWVSSNFQDFGIFSFNLSHLKFFIFEWFLLSIIVFSFFFLLIENKKKYINFSYFLIIYLIFLFSHKNIDPIFILNKSFIIDEFNTFYKILTLIFLILFLPFIKNQVKNSFSFSKDNEFLNYFLLIFFFLIFLIHSFDLISFFITIESSTFILVALVFLQNYSTSNKEAGFKFFFLHALVPNHL